MSSVTHFTKDPHAILDYTVRWIDWLASGDAISSSSWIVESGIVTVSTSNTTSDAIIFLASGTVGQIYEVTNRIITTGSRQDERTISILIEDK